VGGTDKYAASCVLESHTSGNVRSTTTLKLQFPMCKPCHTASARSSTSMAAGGFVGMAAGYFVLTAFVDTSKDVTFWVLLCGLVAIFTGAVAFGALAYYIWGRIAGPDQRARAKMSSVPVKMRSVPPASLEFEFSNDGWGEAFSAMNP
jgi:hypothetical protein